LYQDIGVGIRDYLQLWRGRNVTFYFLIWLACGVFVLLRGSITHLIRIEWLDIDFIPVFLIDLIAKEQGFKAICLAFLMGLLADISSSCPLGLFAFTYSAIILGMNSCRQFLDFTNIKTAVLLVAVFLVAKRVLVLAAMSVFPLGQSLPSIRFMPMAVSVLVTSLITPLILYVLDLARGREDRDYA
jgi:rod shape-determining protein MreD